MLTARGFWLGVDALTTIVEHPDGPTWGNESRAVQAVVIAGYQHAAVRNQFADVRQAVRWVQHMVVLAEIFGPETAIEVGMMVTLERLGELAESPELIDPVVVRAAWVLTEPGRLLVAEGNAQAAAAAQWEDRR